MDQTTTQRDTRRAGKREQIMDGARRLFLQHGFAGASMDEIVRAAGVSKGTVYNYFPSKEELFIAFVEEECSARAGKVAEADADAPDFDAEMLRLAEAIIRTLLSPAIVDIYRIAMAEAPRFPDLGRTFYECGPDLAVRQIAEFLAAASEKGRIEAPDPLLAARQLDQLCKARLFYRNLFQVQSEFSDEEIREEARLAAECFLRAYQTS